METIELDMLSDEFTADPDRIYADLRRNGGVHLVVGGRDPWVLVTRYGLGRAILADARFTKRLPDAYIAVSSSAGSGRSMLGSDPPEHTRLRATMAPLFSPAGMRRFAPGIARHASDAIDRVGERLSDDAAAPLRELVALPVTFAALADAIGVPEADLDRFHGWTRTILSPALTDEQQDQQASAMEHLRDFVTSALGRARTEPPTSSVLASLAHDHADDALNDDEAVTMVTLLIAAGYEGTANLVLNTIAACLTGGHWSGLSAGRVSAVDVVDEGLRYNAPVQRATLRVASTDVELDGTAFPRGTFVGVSLAAANHDPDRFDDPGAFRPRPGSSTGHLAFGHGIHRCLGAELAVVEARTVIAALAQAEPDLILAPGRELVEWSRTGFLRGPEELWVARGGPAS